MEAIAFYLLKSTLWLTGFALIYFLFLRNERFFVLNRFYLLSGIFASLVFPFITIRYAVELSSSSTVDVLAPVLQGFTKGQDAYSISTIALFTFYLSGVFYFAWRMLYQTNSVVKVIRNAEVDNLGFVKLIKSDKYPSSFSYFSFVFVNPSTTDVETKEIVNHESEHVRQKHWFDLLLAEVLCMIQWFNPVVWFYGQLIRQNHEYLADQVALQRTTDPAIYRAALLNQLFGGPVITLANSFNYSLNKKRFKMMKTTRTSPFRKVKIALILPLIALFFYAFAKPEIVINQKNNISFAGEANTIKGKVVDSDGKKLSGAAVILAATTTGTTTDKDGNFELKGVPKDGEIIFSFVGYKTVKMKPDFDKSMDIKMSKRNIGMDEIVVVGSGEMSKTDQKNGVKIRDVNSANPPLIFLDGVEINKSRMEGINPETIESINVLKDESSTKKYGEKGKNGVILITSKKGKEVYTVVEELPEFPGGKEAMMKWIAQNVKYPDQAKKEKVQGKVIVSYIVNETGKIENVKVERSVNPVLDAEAVRVVSSMPELIPGTQAGKKISVRLTIPIQFKLQ